MWWGGVHFLAHRFINIVVLLYENSKNTNSTTENVAQCYTGCGELRGKAPLCVLYAPRFCRIVCFMLMFLPYSIVLSLFPSNIACWNIEQLGRAWLCVAWSSPLYYMTNACLFSLWWCPYAGFWLRRFNSWTSQYSGYRCQFQWFATVVVCPFTFDCGFHKQVFKNMMAFILNLHGS